MSILHETDWGATSLPPLLGQVMGELDATKLSAYVADNATDAEIDEQLKSSTGYSYIGFISPIDSPGYTIINRYYP